MVTNVGRSGVCVLFRGVICLHSRLFSSLHREGWGGVEERIIQVDEVHCACRSGEEHAGDVLGSGIVLHAQQVAGPAQVILLRQLRLAAEHQVVALATSRQLQHHQSQLVLPGQDALPHLQHLLPGDMVHVHAHGGGWRGASLQHAVLARQAAVVHLQQSALHLLVTLAHTAHHRLLLLCVAEISVLRCRQDGAHPLHPILVVDCIATHSRLILNS